MARVREHYCNQHYEQNTQIKEICRRVGDTVPSLRMSGSTTLDHSLTCLQAPNMTGYTSPLCNHGRGGVYERLIKPVKISMYKSLHEQTPSGEELNR
ncbi:hypothetical protein COOONC_00854 [Cooperia oncophora]